MFTFYGRNSSFSSSNSQVPFVAQKIVNSGEKSLVFSCSKNHQKKVLLGTITKSQACIATQGFQRNYNLKVFDQDLISRTHFDRIFDYSLQFAASKILGKKARVSGCRKRKIDKNKLRSVVFNPVTRKSYYANVQRCGSIWNCKLCARKVTESRKHELAKAVSLWKSGVCSISFDFSNKLLVGPVIPDVRYIRGFVYMITLTNSHNASHNLEFLRSGQKKAMEYFFGHFTGRALFSFMGKKGHVTNYEITYGQNGWHPHHHILVFSDRDLSLVDKEELAQFEIDFKHYWINCCKLAKLPLPSFEHGLDIVIAKTSQEMLAHYVSKWGVDNEMTKGHLKTGKNGSYTPFDLLKLFIAGDELVYNRKPSDLFKEYSVDFKGARQLFWSNGLKNLFGINDKSDEDIIAETLEDSEHDHDVGDMLFSLLVKYKKLAHYLNAFETDILYGTQQLDALINDVVSQEIAILQERVELSDRI